MRSFIAVFFLGSFFSAAAQGQPVSKAITFFKKGKQQEQQGMYLQAVDTYKKGILADKKYDSTPLALASLYLRLSQNDSAVTVLKNALKTKPGFAGAHEMLGLIFRDYVRNSTEAIKHYTNAVKYDSSNKVNYYSLAWCSNDLKKYQDAITYADKALDIDNNYKAAYNEMAHAVRNLKAYTDGIAHFKKRLAVSVNELPLYYSALCYLELKDKEGANKMYDELFKINPKSAEVLKKKIDAVQ
jgi:tetratricopeptide (TPR) repeat protein